MRVAIAGAGNVGRSIAAELLENGHEVLLIEREPAHVKPGRPEGAQWLTADACEFSTLERAELDRCQVVIAATGDDKVNLVVSLLAKTEFAVPRTVARINHPKNEWLFTDAWGVDVAVSTPRLMTALVEEAVSVGDLVRLLTFEQGRVSLVEFTLPPACRLVDQPLSAVLWPADTAPVVVLRDGHVLLPQPDLTLQAGDELLVVATAGSEPLLDAILC